MMKEEWLLNGAIVPVDLETTAALVAEIHRLIGVVGGMALAQPAQEPVQPAEEWLGQSNIDSLHNACQHRGYCKQLKAQSAQETDMLTIAYQSGYYDGKKAAHRQWVGLTDADIADCMEMSIQKTCRAVEQLLKEKNNGT